MKEDEDISLKDFMCSLCLRRVESDRLNSKAEEKGKLNKEQTVGVISFYDLFSCKSILIRFNIVENILIFS